MATTMCQNHPDQRAVFIGTVLEPDIVAVAVCDECMPLFCAAVFEEMTGVDMSPALYLASQEGQENPDGPPPNGTVTNQAAQEALQEPGKETGNGQLARERAALQEASEQAGAPPEQAPADVDGGRDLPPGPAAPSEESALTSTPAATGVAPGGSQEGPPDGSDGEQAAGE